jgi:S1-C subfamily serine protease
MRRSLALLTLAAALAPAPARADDIAPETVTSVKHSTVFIRVEGATWKGSGSGFVIVASGGDVLVATNCHVIAGPDFDKARPRPAELLKTYRGNKITAIFDAGTKAETALKADLIAADHEIDLAVIRVNGLKSPPKPIPYASPPKPVETMSIVAFGYPLGDTLATGKAAPAVTVSKGSVSSLRNDDDGELQLVQIDASINPGNSGGPVVDAKGRLVGVVVSGYRGAQGLNFAIPAADLGNLMAGRLDGFHLTATRSADGKVTIKAEVGVLDPSAAVRTAALHYAVVPPNGKRPKANEALSLHAGAKKVNLTVRGGVATGELQLDAAEGNLFVQAVPDGRPAGRTRLANYSLAIPKAAGEVVLGGTGASGGPGAGEVDAPAGWKEYTSSNKLYKAWVPEKARISSKSRTTNRPGSRVVFNSMVADVPGAGAFLVEQITLIPRPRNLKTAEVVALLREIVVAEIPGSAVERSVAARLGKFSGVEFLVVKGAAATRGRVFVIGGNIFFLRAVGTRAQGDGADGTTFLESCRLQVRPAPGGGQVQVPPGPGPRPGPGPGPGGQPGSGAQTSIAGGAAGDAEFRDPVPAGATLAGLEIRLAKAGEKEFVHSIRPVFRTGDDKSVGTWHGSADAKAVVESFKVVGRSGYAVGAVTVKPGPNVHGLSVRFMKIDGGRLNPGDAYDTEWIGTRDVPGPTVLVGGKGEQAQGLLGKGNAQGVSGLGLAFSEGGKGAGAMGPGDGVAQAPPGEAPVVPPSGQPAPEARKRGERGPRIQGGGGNPEFRDVAPEGGALAGFEVGLGKFFNNDTVIALRPIYRVGDKEVRGEQYGTDTRRLVRVVAKPGYAVGGISVKTGLGLDGMSVTFMKLGDGQLDPKDAYESAWIGGAGGGGPVRVGGDGSLVVGLLVKQNEKDVAGVGLIYSDTNKPGLDGAWPKGTPSAMVGGGGDPEFREAGPEGSLLVGLEVGVGRFFDNKVIVAVRPIFRNGDKDIDGEWHGAGDDKIKETVRVVAKPGYAVGGFSIKSGLGMDGMSITFMKVVNGKPNIKDHYESEWIGGMGGGGPNKVGTGLLVIGLTGKARSDTVSGLGLLHPPAPRRR